jgi:glycosyltransferase involved in cell wall biosynthesis
VTRILVVTNLYPPHHLGGYELSCRDVVERWKARGHSVTILTTKTRIEGVADPPNERASGIRRDLTWYWEDHRLLKPSFGQRLAIERANHAALEQAIADANPEVVSAWAMGVMSLGLLTRVVERALPLVLVVCDGWLWYGPKLDRWSRTFLGRPRLSRFVRRRTGVPTGIADLGHHAVFCFVSDAIRRWSAERSAWTPEISTVVYSGIDRSDFPPVDPTPADRPWRWRLLCIGRLDDRKGVHIAIEALSRLPGEATLDIIGRGDSAYEARLRALADRPGLRERVRFSVVERGDLRRIYSEADAVLFPTLWEEPFGLVPVEAMACGTPVVATGTGGSTEFLLDGFNCLRVPPGDADALAEALRRLAADPALRSRLAEGGLRTAADLDVDRLADVLEAWHIAAAEGFARGRPPDRQLAFA